MTPEEMLTGESAQATITQTSVLLHVLQLLHIQTQLHMTAEHKVAWTNEDAPLINPC